MSEIKMSAGLVASEGCEGESVASVGLSMHQPDLCLHLHLVCFPHECRSVCKFPPL